MRVTLPPPIPRPAAAASGNDRPDPGSARPRKQWQWTLLTLLSLVTGSVQAQTGKNGARAIAAAGTIVNEYTALTADAVSGATSITVAANTLNANTRFPGVLAAGDLVMIIQMQGATINTTATDANYGQVTAYNNAGKYEVEQVAGISGGTTINFYCGLSNSYTATGKVQVVRMPRYTTLTINNNATITAPAWDGTIGGIVAVETSGATTIGTTAGITVVGKGFRGGAASTAVGPTSAGSDYANAANTYGGQKGEGIAGFLNSYGRGAAANGGGGGNAYKAGGGGGANAGTGTYSGTGNPATGFTAAWNQESAGFATSTSSGGGRGGYSNSTTNQVATTTGPGNAAWGGDSRKNLGGLGGRPLDRTGGRLFMGGGGGGGTTAGGAGGGIIYLLTSNGDFSGNNQTTSTLLANGAAGTVGAAAGDAPGGGGGGGSFVLNIGTVNYGYTFTASANGGAGGSATSNNVAAGGPGGGGGGGFLSYPNGANLGFSTYNATAGANGTTTSASLTEFLPNGATAGGAGVKTEATYLGQCVSSADVKTTMAGATTAPAGSEVTYTVTVDNTTGPETANGVAVVIALPATVNAASVSLSDQGSYNAATNQATFPAFNLASGATTTRSIRFIMPASGSVTGSVTSTSASYDSNAANNNGTNNASVTTTATQVADVAITLGGPTEIVASKQVIYSALLTNYGPSTGTGITAKLDLTGTATGITVTDGNGATAGTVAGNTITFTVPGGSLATGASLAYIVRYTAPASGTVSGTVSSTSSTANGDPNANNGNGSTADAKVTTTVLTTAPATRCAAGGTAGNLTFNATTTSINSFYPGVGSAAANQKTVTIGAIRATTPASTALAKDDLVVIMQMQGADLNATDTDSYGNGYSGTPANGQLSTNLLAGEYEYGVVANIAGTTVTLRDNLVHSYSTTAATATKGRTSFQLVRVPQYQSVILNTNVSNIPAWDGSTGGLFVLDVAGQLDFNGKTVDLKGKGFRGGAGLAFRGDATLTTTYRSAAPGTLPTGVANGVSNATGAHASKGEGIAGTPRYANSAGAFQDNTTEGYPNGSFGRGAPGNEAV